MTGIDEMDDLLILFPNNNLADVGEEEIIPENFVLHQNYPAPFNPSTKIKFQISDFGPVSLNIYVVIENVASYLDNEDLTAEEYRVEFDIRATHPIALPSRIYFYQFEVNGLFIDTKE